MSNSKDRDLVDALPRCSACEQAFCSEACLNLDGESYTPGDGCGSRRTDNPRQLQWGNPVTVSLACGREALRHSSE